MWKVKTEEKALYLTFDDGPTPGVTEWVMELLEKFNAQATFFCVGENMSRFPNIVADLRKRGHVTANHTYSHLNGWKTSTGDYLQDIERCSNHTDSKLFRPPYGRITLNQVKEVTRKYKIVMWSLLSGDFDRKLDYHKCINFLQRSAAKGSIIVFHDSLKAEQNLQRILPPLMEYYSRQGYIFRTL